MVIDGHAHACGRYLNKDKIIEYLDNHGIDKVVLCSGELGSRINYHIPYFSKIFQRERFVYLFNGFIWLITRIVGLPKQIGKGNIYVYKLSRSCPLRILNAYWINPLEKNCISRMESFYKKYGFVMVKFHQCWHQYDIDTEKCRKIYKWAAKNKLPVFIHLRSDKQVEKFIKVSNKYKDTVFIIAHMIGFKKISKYSKNDNIYYDLSSPQVYSEELFRAAVKEADVSHIILGSDTPYGTDNIERIKKMLLKADLSAEEIEKISGKNLEALIKRRKINK